MNIFNFFNSKALTDYHRQLGTDFPPTAAAYIIWQSRYCTIEERHAAWRELMDMAGDKAIANIEFPTLYKLISAYIKLEEGLLEKFYHEDNESCYLLSCRKCGATRKQIFDNIFFENFDECVNAMQEIQEHMGHIYEWKILNSSLDSVDEDFSIALSVTDDGQPINFDRNYMQRSFDDEYQAFASLAPHISTPFEFGDIVQLPDGTPCVIDFSKQRNTVHLDNHSGFIICRDIKTGTSTARLYFVNDCGQATHAENIDELTTLDLEFFRGELTGKQKILQPISQFVKSEDNFIALLNATHDIIMDECKAKLNTL